MRTSSAALISLLLLVPAPLLAGSLNTDAVLGGALGGGVGALIGSEVGGRNGAILGAAIGGATGTALTTRRYYRPRREVVYVDRGRYHRHYYRHGHYEDD
jgi:hypothetical protein